MNNFCDSHDCTSQIKILRTVEDIQKNHSDHIVKIKAFDQLREELQDENYPLKNLQMNINHEILNQFIDDNIVKIVESFNIIVQDLRAIFKSYVSTQIKSLVNLTELYKEVMDKNETKIEELQDLIPQLHITNSDIKKIEVKSKQVEVEIQRVVKEISDRIQSLKNVILNNPVDKYQWSNDLKHKEIIINGKQMKSAINSNSMILLEPCLTRNDVTKVTLKITKLTTIKLMVSLCDANISRNIRSTWDHRTNVKEGSYSHQQNGGIYPHHLQVNQYKGQTLAFVFKEGDVLELQWNGPLKQFITFRPSTKERYFLTLKS